jgi:hypothetical protein
MNEEKSPAKIAPGGRFRGDCGFVLRGYRETRVFGGEGFGQFFAAGTGIFEDSLRLDD